MRKNNILLYPWWHNYKIVKVYIYLTCTAQINYDGSTMNKIAKYVKSSHEIEHSDIIDCKISMITNKYKQPNISLLTQ